MSIRQLLYEVHGGASGSLRDRAFTQLVEHPNTKWGDFLYLLDVLDKHDALYARSEERLLAYTDIDIEQLLKLTLYGVATGLREKAFTVLKRRSDITAKNLRLIAISSSCNETCMQAAKLLLERADVADEDLEAVSSMSNCSKVRHMVRRFYDERIERLHPPKHSMK